MSLRFFDIHQLWAIATNLLSFYREWYGKEVELTSLRAAITLENIWRLVPFCDIDEWGIHVQKFGLPTQNADSVRIPTKKGRSLEVDFPFWTTICPIIGVAFGLPTSMYLAKML